MASVPHGAVHASEYERMRLENIRRNKEMLQASGLSSILNDLKEKNQKRNYTSQRAASKTGRPESEKLAAKEPGCVAERRSRRLEGQKRPLYFTPRRSTPKSGTEDVQSSPPHAVGAVPEAELHAAPNPNAWRQGIQGDVPREGDGEARGNARTGGSAEEGENADTGGSADAEGNAETGMGKSTGNTESRDLPREGSAEAAEAAQSVGSAGTAHDAEAATDLRHIKTGFMSGRLQGESAGRMGNAGRVERAEVREREGGVRLRKGGKGQYSGLGFLSTEEFEVPEAELDVGIDLDAVLSFPKRRPETTVEWEKLAKRLGGCRESWKLQGSVMCLQTGTTCHQCGLTTIGLFTHCATCSPPSGQYCGNCLQKWYGENVEEAVQDLEWQCPHCRDICCCMYCFARKGWEPISQFQDAHA